MSSGPPRKWLKQTVLSFANALTSKTWTAALLARQQYGIVG